MSQIFCKAITLEQSSFASTLVNSYPILSSLGVSNLACLQGLSTSNIPSLRIIFSLPMSNLYARLSPCDIPYQESASLQSYHLLYNLFFKVYYPTVSIRNEVAGSNLGGHLPRGVCIQRETQGPNGLLSDRLQGLPPVISSSFTFFLSYSMPGAGDDRRSLVTCPIYTTKAGHLHEKMGNISAAAARQQNGRCMFQLWVYVILCRMCTPQPNVSNPRKGQERRSSNAILP